jgi:hypothetical protein
VNNAATRFLFSKTSFSEKFPDISYHDDDKEKSKNENDDVCGKFDVEVIKDREKYKNGKKKLRNHLPTEFSS